MSWNNVESFRIDAGKREVEMTQAGSDDLRGENAVALALS